MNIRNYIAWAERKIGEVVIGEKLHVGMLGVIQGPLTITFRLRLIQTSRSAMSKLLALGPALGQALQVEGVRISDMPDHIAIEIPSPYPRTPSSYDLAMASDGLSPAVGLDSYRRPVRMSLADHGAIFWIGPSRRGKTQSMRSTLFSLAVRNPATLRYAIFCHPQVNKQADWLPFVGAVGCCGIVTDPAEQVAALEWISGDLMSSIRPGLAFVVMVDDLINLLEQADLAPALANIASVGAGAGVHLLAGTQDGGSKKGTGGSGVSGNSSARIIYRTTDAGSAARSTGQKAEGVQALTGEKGDALLLLGGTPTRIATGLADDGDIMRLEQGDGWRRPWAATRVTSAAATSKAMPPLNAAAASRGQAADASMSDEATPTWREAFPIEKRQPDQREATLIREMKADGASLNKLCLTVYGHKDGKGMAFIKAALGDDKQGPARTAKPALPVGYRDIPNQ